MIRFGLRIAAFLFALALVSSDALALGSRGSVVSGRRGVTSDGRNSVKGPMGEKGSNNGGGGGGGARKDERPAFRKWPLPPEVKVAELDTTKFDAIADKLKLKDEQVFRIDSARKAISEKGEKLAKAQSEARSNYDRARDQFACLVAAREVAKAAASCRNFLPSFSFTRELRKILTSDQYTRYRQLKAKI